MWMKSTHTYSNFMLLTFRRMKKINAYNSYIRMTKLIYIIATLVYIRNFTCSIYAYMLTSYKVYSAITAHCNINAYIPDYRFSFSQNACITLMNKNTIQNQVYSIHLCTTSVLLPYSVAWILEWRAVRKTDRKMNNTHAPYAHGIRRLTFVLYNWTSQLVK